MVTQAETCYAQAVADDDPDALQQYAKFLRRRGRLDRSFEINQSLLGRSSSAEGVPNGDQLAFNSDILANMAVIRRKQGNLPEAVDLLRQAVQSAREAGYVGRKQLAYSLEILGWSLDDLAIGSKQRDVTKRHCP